MCVCVRHLPARGTDHEVLIVLDAGAYLGRIPTEVVKCIFVGTSSRLPVIPA